ncbi:MAG: ribosomal RNA small subunit methyltransferase A [Chloroflexi bacterium]|nr:ribosomal RNA small subunit methyltransferase A [Chloroflexota bacterium]
MSETPSLIRETRRILREFGLRPRKGLGQHFLVDRGVLARLLAAADLSPADTVIEVGPGLGVLTRELAKAAGQVIAVEKDAQLMEALGQTLSGLANARPVLADILAVAPSDLLRDALGQLAPYKVVADLPYYITAPVLRHFLEADSKPSLMVVMVQKEVAQNIVAAAGEMSIIAVAVQLYGRPRVMSSVPASSFYPPPKVDSAILRIDVYERLAVDVPDVATFFKLVRAGFGARRKQIHNALANNLGLAQADASGLLEAAGVDPKRRAQTLSLEEWARLARGYQEARV